MTRYGIIGFGRIGQRLAARMGGPDAPELAAVLVRPGQADAARHSTTDVAFVSDIRAFIDCGLDIAVECASAATLTAWGPLLLRTGVDLVPLSLAALADPLVEAQFQNALAAGAGRIELAAGAMASLDFLATAREDTLNAVIFRAAYPPARWVGTPAADRIDLARVTERTVFFRGSVRQAAGLFPRHLNVSVAVALAGLGLDTTMAELSADPALRQADFSVDAIAGAGSIRLYVGPRDVAAGADPVDHTTFSVMRVLRRRGARIAV